MSPMDIHDNAPRPDAIKKFRKKPVVIEAVLWDGKLPYRSFQEVVKMAGVSAPFYIDGLDRGLDPTGRLAIRTLEGTMMANDGDWIIKGVNGEFYPCKPDIFEKTYEPA